MARHDASDLAARLGRNAEAVCRHYLSSGHRAGRYWMVGDVQNTPGRSMFVRLTGPESGKGAAGKWTDSATGEHGDLLDVIRERKVSNLKGDLPTGFSLGRNRSIDGIGAVTIDDLSNRLAGENLSRLLSAAGGLAAFLQERQQAGGDRPVDPAAARRFMTDANRLAALLDELGLHGPLK